MNFRAGRIYKIKVEFGPDRVGFGRATVVMADNHDIFIQIRSSKGGRKMLPNGSRVWFVGDSSTNPFNGLWSTSVIDTRIVNGKTVMRCPTPRFQSLSQRRQHDRAPFRAPVRIEAPQFAELRGEIYCRNLSRSGMGISIGLDCAEKFSPGAEIDLILEGPNAEVFTSVKVLRSKYNWLANRTDVGLEFCDMSHHSAEALDKLLVWLGSRPRKAGGGEEGEDDTTGGGLYRWMKSTRDDLSLLKPSARSEAELRRLKEQAAAETATGPEDFDEDFDLDDVDEDDFVES